MAQKHFLHELLNEDQEPFRLQNYIADRRHRLKKPPPPPPPATNLHLGKRNPNPIHEPSTRRRRNILCFLPFQSSPDVTKSPFLDFPSKSPNDAVFLRIPSKTADLLVQAATRIQNQHQPKHKAHSAKSLGLGLLGSFLKRLKTKTRAIAENGVKASDPNATVHKPSAAAASAADDDDEESVRMSDNELDFEASTSSCGSEFSPFRFNLQNSPPPAGHNQEFYSPAGPPSRRVNQEEENYRTSNSDNVQGEEEEKEEQFSPVSVFDPPFEENVRLSGDADEDDDYDLECRHENVLRVKQQLLYRLQRFEKLAELDTIELEGDPLEGSDYEDHRSDSDENLLLYMNMSTDMKKLVSDLITEEKSEIVNSCDNEVVMSRIRNKLDSWREVEPNTIDMMVGFDLKRELDGWTRFNEQVEEISAGIEVAIFGLLVEELSQELV